MLPHTRAHAHATDQNYTTLTFDLATFDGETFYHRLFLRLPLVACTFFRCVGIFAFRAGMTPHSNSLRSERLLPFSPEQGFASNFNLAAADQWPHCLQKIIWLLPCIALIR